MKRMTEIGANIVGGAVEQLGIYPAGEEAQEDSVSRKVFAHCLRRKSNRPVKQENKENDFGSAR